MFDNIACEHGHKCGENIFGSFHLENGNHIITEHHHQLGTTTTKKKRTWHIWIFYIGQKVKIGFFSLSFCHRRMAQCEWLINGARNGIDWIKWTSCINVCVRLCVCISSRQVLVKKIKYSFGAKRTHLTSRFFVVVVVATSRCECARVQLSNFNVIYLSLPKCPCESESYVLLSLSRWKSRLPCLGS